jgi:hypothetical protein
MPLVRQFEPSYQPYRGNIWRVIEGQYRSSTVRIVDTDDEHNVLEKLLEESKPPVPAPCQHLDYQFWSPFRYGKYPKSSRFRRAGPTPGVWYGAEDPLTAVCETIWGAVRFYSASPATPMPRWPVEHTAVQADIQTAIATDLISDDMKDQGRWMDPNDYSDCLLLAEQVRDDHCAAIRYASVRHPENAPNIAVLQCSAFAQPAPIGLQTWHIMLTPTHVRAHCETLRQKHMFVVGDSNLVRA